MSKRDAMSCPKCGGKMERAESLYTSLFLIDSKAVVLETKESKFFGEKIIPIFCKNCGYIELYKKMKEEKE